MKVFASIFSVASAVDLKWEDCGSASTHATVTDLQPTHLDVPGSTTLVATGTVDSDQTGGTFKFTAKTGPIPVLKGSGTLCEDTVINLPLGAGSIKFHALDCPVAAGDVSISLDLDLASEAASTFNDLLKISLTAVNDAGDDLLCVDISGSDLKKKKYPRGYVRKVRNGLEEVAEITDEMRAAAPDSLDWSAKGATSPVKDQGECGSCWAFSATEGIESAVFMNSGEMPVLSTEQIVDCDKDDDGCDGGDLPEAFDYAKKNGMATADDYPDTSSDSGRAAKCKKSVQKSVKVTGWKYAIPPCNSGSCKNQKESDMMAALNTYGPLSVCVNAEDWDGYSSGIYKKKCSGKVDDLDHCVQLVGYDKSENYWKVRNSWASDWGEKGFIRIPMGENACGIADEATYVTAAMDSSVEI